MIKRYAPNWNKIYQFAEYGDYDNFFIELCYIVSRQSFTSALGAPLINKTGIDGKPIFKNVNIDFSKYKLLNERVEPLEDSNVGLLRVFETYGYAPARNYQFYSAEPVLQFGLEDPSGYLEKTASDATYDVSDDEFTLTLNNTEGLAVGDLIKASFVGYPNPSGGYYNNAFGPSVAIKSVSGNNIVVPAFELTLVSRNSGEVVGSLTKDQTAVFINTPNSPTGWQGARDFIREATTRTPRTIITTVFNDVSFYTEFPQLDHRYIVSSGTNETDTITPNTTPTTSEWKQMIADGTLIAAQDAAVEAVFPTTFFKKTIKRIRAR